jgi:hypothetical protein
MLQEVLENDDFLEVSSVKRLVNISGTVSAIDLTFLQVKFMGLLHSSYGSMSLLQRHHYYGVRTWNYMNISGTKRAINLTFSQVKYMGLMHMGLSV